MSETGWLISESILNKIKDELGIDMREIAQCPTCGAPVRIEGGSICAVGDWDLRWHRIVEMELRRDLEKALMRNINLQEKLSNVEVELTRQKSPINGGKCCLCGRSDGLDFLVPDETWKEVVPESVAEGAGLLCLWCFDRLALLKGIRYNCKLYFAGRAGNGGNDD